jgi:hypothetical protein
MTSSKFISIWFSHETTYLNVFSAIMCIDKDSPVNRLRACKQAHIRTGNVMGTNDINTSEDNNRKINGYIVKAIRSCYMDQLKLRGINRRLTKSEASGNRYESIQTQAIDDTDEDNFISSPTEGPDQYVFIREAYSWIESCFNSASSDMKDTVKRSFFNAAFWEFDNYGLPMKELAIYLGYKSSNPTQELKRFTEKVSLCTGPHGILINNPHEQIQFLREQLENAETAS